MSLYEKKLNEEARALSREFGKQRERIDIQVFQKIAVEQALPCCKDPSWRFSFGISELEGRLYLFRGCGGLFNGTEDPARFTSKLYGQLFPALFGGKLV